MNIVTKATKPALVITAAMLALSVTSIVGSGAAQAATTQYGFSAIASGTSVTTAGGIVTSGNSSLLNVGCTREAPQTFKNSAASINVAPILTTGTIATTANTNNAPVAARASSSVQNVRILNGLVRATAVTSVSRTTKDLLGYHVSAAGTTFTGLVIAGIPISANVTPGTKINLPGFGYVVLNGQAASVGLNQASLGVVAIHVVIDTNNSLNVLIGTNITVGYVHSGLAGSISGVLNGNAYGTQVQVANGVLTSGPTFPVSLPCYGTQGLTTTNTGAGINVPGVLTSGTINNTAYGVDDVLHVEGKMTAETQGVNLLNSLLNASVIKADVRVNKLTGQPAVLTDASNFTTLTVAGYPLINASVAPNTSVSIANLGTLWLHRVIKTGNSIEVRMVELVVTLANSFGLPIGSNVRIGVARVAAF